MLVVVLLLMLLLVLQLVLMMLLLMVMLLLAVVLMLRGHNHGHGQRRRRMTQIRFDLGLDFRQPGRVGRDACDVRVVADNKKVRALVTALAVGPLLWCSFRRSCEGGFLRCASEGRLWYLLLCKRDMLQPGPNAAPDGFLALELVVEEALQLDGGVVDCGVLPVRVRVKGLHLDALVVGDLWAVVGAGDAGGGGREGVAVGQEGADMVWGP